MISRKLSVLCVAVLIALWALVAAHNEQKEGGEPAQATGQPGEPRFDTPGALGAVLVHGMEHMAF